MAQPQKIEPPRIFISHTWEEKDKALTHVLENALREAGAEVWVDHAGIRGGDNLPKQINDALDWCNTLVLVWSKAAKTSHWVELEWTNAISLQKRIIPCPHDGTPPPPILANKAYVDFKNTKLGLDDLLRALQLASTSGDDEDEAVPARVRHPQVLETPSPILKQSQEEPLLTPRESKPVTLQLRRYPVHFFSRDNVKYMLREHDFYCVEHEWSKDWSHSSGKGIKHSFEVRHDGQVVVDHVTGLSWQQSGSPNYMTYTGTEKFIHDLNAKRFVGYEDWRLPTLEEAMSLMEPVMKAGLYIDPVFDYTQKYIWTADADNGREWFVNFSYGICDRVVFIHDPYVRAVRS